MKLCIIAGEASGDLHASEVVRELRNLVPRLETFGIGGDLLAAQGVRLLHHAREMGIVGLFNVLRHLSMFRAIFRDIIAAIEREKPDAVLLVDYPDFNLRVARACKERGFKVIYYISPQVWAWRRRRVRHISRYVDHMLVLFPFEEEFYREHDVPVTHVGHPLIEQLSAVRSSGLGSDRSRAVRLALLPGSRRNEIDALLEPMLGAVALLKEKLEIDPFVVRAPTIETTHLERIFQRCGVRVRIVDHARGAAVGSADVALASSGTATLEAAVIGVPVVVMYRLSPGTYAVARRLVKLPHFSLVNIIADSRVVPELLQAEVTPQRIANEVMKLIEPGTYEEVRQALVKVRERLGSPGASRRAAEEIVRLVGVDAQP